MERAFLVFITKNEAKLDEHFCSNLLKTTFKTPKKIFPIQSADAHKTINNNKIPYIKWGSLQGTGDMQHMTPDT